MRQKYEQLLAEEKTMDRFVWFVRNLLKDTHIFQALPSWVHGSRRVDWCSVQAVQTQTCKLMLTFSFFETPCLIFSCLVLPKTSYNFLLCCFVVVVFRRQQQWNSQFVDLIAKEDINGNNTSNNFYCLLLPPIYSHLYSQWFKSKIGSSSARVSNNTHKIWLKFTLVCSCLFVLVCSLCCVCSATPTKPVKGGRTKAPKQAFDEKSRAVCLFHLVNVFDCEFISCFSEWHFSYSYRRYCSVCLLLICVSCVVIKWCNEMNDNELCSQQKHWILSLMWLEMNWWVFWLSFACVWIIIQLSFSIASFSSWLKLLSRAWFQGLSPP